MGQYPKDTVTTSSINQDQQDHRQILWVRDTCNILSLIRVTRIRGTRPCWGWGPWAMGWRHLYAEVGTNYKCYWPPIIFAAFCCASHTIVRGNPFFTENWGGVGGKWFMSEYIETQMTHPLLRHIIFILSIRENSHHRCVNTRGYSSKVYWHSEPCRNMLRYELW